MSNLETNQKDNWFQNEFLSRMQFEEMNYLLQYGIGACLLFAIGIILGLGFDKYQDQIKEGIGKMVQAIMEIMVEFKEKFSNSNEIGNVRRVGLILSGILIGLFMILTNRGHLCLIIE